MERKLYTENMLCVAPQILVVITLQEEVAQRTPIGIRQFNFLSPALQAFDDGLQLFENASV
jgi:hypothetical protein